MEILQFLKLSVGLISTTPTNIYSKLMLSKYWDHLIAIAGSECRF